MTNLKSVTEGFNKFCGPAVLSILTGKSTDECAYAITKVNGQYNVAGVQLTDLLKAADNLGFTSKAVQSFGSLYRTLVTLVRDDGMYIVTIPKHFVCIEIKESKIYFCDNHTKEPIPAASSARLGMTVVAIHKVTAKEKLPEPVLIPIPVCNHTLGRVYCDDCNVNMIHVRKWVRITLAGDSFEVYGTEENLTKLSRFITEMSSFHDLHKM